MIKLLMRQKHFLFGLLLIIILSSFHLKKLKNKPQLKRPNILFCIADDATFLHFSAYGSKWVKTPSFDRVANAGLLFKNAYTPNAKCAPSRACILTGRNSWQLGPLGNHLAYWPDGAYMTFVEALSQNGYQVGYTGKPWAPGDPGKINGHIREVTGKAYNNSKTTPPTSGISNIDYSQNFEDFLKKKNKDEPFCFWYGGLEPHRAYEYGSGAKLGRRPKYSIDYVP
jgi:arylsulfatase A-like enzyme